MAASFCRCYCSGPQRQYHSLAVDDYTRGVRNLLRTKRSPDLTQKNRSLELKVAHSRTK